MSLIPEISCPVCRRMLPDRSGTGVCPDCRTSAGTEGYAPGYGEQHFGHVNDFRRFSYLCSMLRMFSVEYGFGYSVHRKGSLIEIWIGTGTGNEFLSLDMEDTEVAKSEKMNLIIRRIINFSQ